jgi:hypothetical protein
MRGRTLTVPDALASFVHDSFPAQAAAALFAVAILNSHLERATA